MPRSLSALTLLALLVALPATAAEGMWMPQQIPSLEPQLRALGWNGDPKAFADLTGQPMGAIVSLGGCSASFVSPDGLIVTNHHCVTGALQFNSTPERDLLTNGFLAATREQEVFAGPGSHAYVTIAVKEVTEAITGGIDAKLSDRERYDVIDKRTKERTAACEKDGLRCRVASYFEGMRWYEIAQLDIQDLRLVYSPHEGIGVFGGETDNWQWPRHTGDYSFYRAYVGKDGKPAAYAKDNVPYKPAHWLTVSTRGIAPGEAVFVAGFPGRTQRHQTYGEIKATAQWALPRQVRRLNDQLAILAEISKGSREIEIRVANRVQGFNNSLTKSRGTLLGLDRGGILASKKAQEAALRAWIDGDDKRRAEWGDVFPALDAMQAEGEKTRERDATFGALYGGSSLLGAAQTIHRMAIERPKPDMEREAEFQQRNWKRIADGQERMQKSLDLTADRALFRYALREAAGLPKDQRIEPLDKLAGLAPGMDTAASDKAIDALLDRLYAGTKLADVKVRRELLEKNSADLAAQHDAFLDLAAALYPMSDALRETDKKREGLRTKLRPRYMRALFEHAGGLIAPDANGTLRVTFGRVEGVAERDGLFFQPQTTLAGIVEKNQGKGDFNAPKAELDAIAALRAGKKTPFADPKLGDVPVDFLATVDTTGGNSGSAALDAQGRLVGLLFDGTFDTVGSDIVYDTQRTRSILLDARYMLWVMAEVDHADALLAELGVH